MNDSDQQRQAIRRFVREHHPDRGGDPEAFAEGLRKLREGRPTPNATAVEAYQHKGPIATLSRSYQRWRRRRRRPHPSGRVQ